MQTVPVASPFARGLQRAVHVPMTVPKASSKRLCWKWSLIQILLCVLPGWEIILRLEQKKFDAFLRCCWQSALHGELEARLDAFALLGELEASKSCIQKQLQVKKNLQLPLKGKELVSLV